MDNLAIVFIIVVIYIISTAPFETKLITLAGAMYILYNCAGQENYEESPEGSQYREDTLDKNLAEYGKDFEYTEKQPKDPLDNKNLVDTVFDERENAAQPADGDYRLGERMKDMQMRSKEAILHRTRMTSDSARPYFQEELDEQEKRRWWEHDELDEFLVKDGINWASDNWMKY